MTTETSNARGGEACVHEWVTTNGVGGVAHRSLRCSKCHRDRASLAAPPAASRGGVPYDRDLIARMLDVCGHPKFTLDAYMEQARLLREADKADAANVGTARLAAEGVQAGEVEQRARELL